MEDHRGEFVVVAAGCPGPRADFIEANPGLASRFGQRIVFADFTDADLSEILRRMVAAEGYELAAGAATPAEAAMAREPRGEKFGNARMVRQLLEGAWARQAVRIELERGGRVPSKKMLRTLTASDFDTSEDVLGRRGRVGDNAAMQELKRMRGLDFVKAAVRAIHAPEVRDAERRRRGLTVPAKSRHMVFTGAPGTGKTTVARIVAKVLAEAYSLVDAHAEGFARECVDTLVKLMEDGREDLVVIAAGYQDPMAVFLDSNPGLRSRFDRIVEFEDHDDRVLEEILARPCVAQRPGVVHRP